MSINSYFGVQSYENLFKSKHFSHNSLQGVRIVLSYYINFLFEILLFNHNFSSKRKLKNIFQTKIKLRNAYIFSNITQLNLISDSNS